MSPQLLSRRLGLLQGLCMALAGQGALQSAFAQSAAPRVVDIPTRPGVTQRFVYIAPSGPPKASVILMAGGHGGLQITEGGSFAGGGGNFLVRTRQQFADAGLAVAVIDAPSDKQSPPYLSGNRQRPEHRADVLALIAWLKQQSPVPVWLVGTSRGTQSAAYVATEATPAQGGPDGLVLTSTILVDPKGRAVPQMPLEKLSIPVLVVHHENDGCKVCLFSDMPMLMEKLAKTPKAELIRVSGGQSRGDPCEAMAYHGFNGLEADVVAKISRWVIAAKP
ncbi:alpha/beta hydrolase [Polaromonas sp. LjRoot131]|uniref:alpha/beta hydrolase n=1 Tax=Polaromonas sp. LjRoot131 TaxID=3342262 RepID=UPI003ECE8377